MKAPRLPAESFEGCYVVEVLDEFGSYSVGTFTKDQVEALQKRPPPKCGECCHPHDHEPRQTYTVVGKIEKGMVAGRPLTDWLPYVVMPGKDPLP